MDTLKKNTPSKEKRLINEGGDGTGEGKTSPLRDVQSGVVATGLPERVVQYYLKKLSEGVLLSPLELRGYAEKHSIAGVTEKKLRRLPDAWPSVKKYTELRKRLPRRFQTIIASQYATCMIDLAFMKDRTMNGNKVGFLLAVEIHTHLLHCELLSKKTKASLMSAIKRMLELSPITHLKVLLADRESAILSKRFIDEVKELYSIEIHYLTTRSKAYLAERYIAFVKKRLSQAMAASGSRRWVDKLEPLIRHFNAQKIRGTSYRRNRVTPNNIDDFLREKWKVPDFSTLINVAHINVAGMPEKWVKKMFKFNLGATVLIDRKVGRVVTGLRREDRVEEDETMKRNTTGGPFEKATIEGFYNENAFRVANRFLRTTRDLLLIPIYRLKTLKGRLLRGYFYQNEMTEVSAAASIDSEKAKKKVQEAQKEIVDPPPLEKRIRRRPRRYED